MNRLLLHGVVIVTTGILWLLRKSVWLLKVARLRGINLTHRIEQIRSWAWAKLQNREDDDDGA